MAVTSITQMGKRDYFEALADTDPDVQGFEDFDKAQKRRKRDEDRVVVQPKVARKHKWRRPEDAGKREKVQGVLNFRRVNKGAIKENVDKWHFKVKRQEALERKARMLSASQLHSIALKKQAAKIRLSKRRAEQRLRTSRSKAAAVQRLKYHRERRRALEVRKSIEAFLRYSRE